MKKTLVLFSLFTFCSIVTLGQLPTQIKIGCYKNFNSLKNNTPDYESSFTVEKRTKYEIAMWGGNDYKVNSTDKDLNPKLLKGVWCLFDGDSLYINGIQVNGRPHFCKVENIGKYSYFKAGIPIKRLYKKYGFKNWMLETNYYPGGNLPGGTTASDLALARFPYYFDINMGEIRIVTKELLLNLLSGYTNLKAEFEKEKLNDYSFIHLKYLDKLNLEK